MKVLNRHARRRQDALIRRGKVRGSFVIQFRDLGQRTFGVLKVDNVVKLQREFPLLDGEGKVKAAQDMEKEWAELKANPKDPLLTG